MKSTTVPRALPPFHRWRPLPLSLLAILTAAVSSAVLAQDAPHSAVNSIACRDCHLSHDDPAAQIYNPLGNQNLCLSCHQVGGSAGGNALTKLDQAVPATGLPAGVTAGGSSHRWDSNPSGRAVWLGDRSLAGADGAIIAGGTYTGPYARTYLITITTAGTARSAKFDWAASGPNGAMGTNLTAGSAVAIESGLTLTFLNWRAGTAFRAGDQWRVFARPDLIQPTEVDMQWTMVSQVASCSTCHDQHSQEKEPFEAGAPAWTSPESGNGRHCLRLDNDANQLCAQCHAPRFVSSAAQGSHPVGVTVPTNSTLHPPTTLPLGKNDQKVYCSTCHQMHGSPLADGSLLRAGSQNALCGECHAFADANPSAAHLSAMSGVLWPGGQYGSLFPAVPNPVDRGACGNCHQAHGWPDSANPTNDYPSLLVEGGENLCFTCHDGSPQTKDVKTVYAKTYRHPVTLTGRHSPDEAGNPGNYGSTNRHAECVDCHNPHQLALDTYSPTSPNASGALNGANRVSVENVSATTINYTFRGADDPTPVKEYEVCFTCHSSWTTQPSGQSDLAADFSTQNASFHPVEGQGKNLNIHPGSFTNGWTADKTMFCTDCHTSDDVSVRGPHASTNQFILKKRTIASTTRRPSGSTMARDEQCFDCHNFDTYANSSSSSTVRNYSRFSGSEGHTYHVVSQRYSCYNCHETHGSANRANLLITGRSPGINSYTRTASGGSCSPTCHGSESYSVTYPR